MNIAEKLAQEFGIPLSAVEQTVALIDEGNTIPFIARYRKEMHGTLDDQLLRELADRLQYLRNLEKRRGEVYELITEQEKMTDEIDAALQKASTLAEIEDIYRPFKPKRRTRASIAKEKGLEPLAEYIFAQEDGSADVIAAASGYVDPEITVESCTFDRIGLKHIKDGEWWGTNTEAVKNVFDTKTSDVVSNIRVQVTNCIWGELSTDWLSDKFVQGMTSNIVGSYMLSSSKKQISSGTTFFETVSATADELFPRRAEGDYSVGLSGNVASAGDPRWIQTQDEGI